MYGSTLPELQLLVFAVRLHTRRHASDRALRKLLHGIVIFAPIIKTILILIIMLCVFVRHADMLQQRMA